jgi:uncharacterized protein YqgQ
MLRMTNLEVGKVLQESIFKKITFYRIERITKIVVEDLEMIILEVKKLTTKLQDDKRTWSKTNTVTIWEQNKKNYKIL